MKLLEIDAQAIARNIVRMSQHQGALKKYEKHGCFIRCLRVRQQSPNESRFPVSWSPEDKSTFALASMAPKPVSCGDWRPPNETAFRLAQPVRLSLSLARWPAHAHTTTPPTSRPFTGAVRSDAQHADGRETAAVLQRMLGEDDDKLARGHGAARERRRNRRRQPIGAWLLRLHG